MAMKSSLRSLAPCAVRNSGQGTFCAPLCVAQLPSLWPVWLCRSPRYQAAPRLIGARSSSGSSAAASPREKVICAV
jgi:hypothetical protein